MTLTAASTKHPSPTRDREVICVEFADDKMGIAAALREAFSAAANDPCDRDFAKLLNDLH